MVLFWHPDHVSSSMWLLNVGIHQSSTLSLNHTPSLQYRPPLYVNFALDNSPNHISGPGHSNQPTYCPLYFDLSRTSHHFLLLAPPPFFPFLSMLDHIWTHWYPEVHPTHLRLYHLLHPSTPLIHYLLSSNS